MIALAQSLFSGNGVRFDRTLGRCRRIRLDDTAWVDHAPAWLEGHDEVFAALHDGLRWRAGERTMYDRVVSVPRLYARIPEDGPGHPALAEMGAALAERYEGAFPWVSCNLYRDGADSVAPHADHLPADNRFDPLAIVSVGDPRPFVLRPKAGGRSITFRLGWGDLVVLGGTVHVDWLHGVPKIARAGPRISVMFRRGYEPDGSGRESAVTLTGAWESSS